MPLAATTGRHSDRALRFAAIVVVLCVSVAMLVMRPAIGFDAWRGLLASEQKIDGRTGSVLVLSTTDPDALDHDRPELISWWPPGQQAAVYALRVAGLSLGHAVKVLVIAAWLVGMSSWALYFLLAAGDRRMALALIAAFALLGASHRMGMAHTGGETIYWAGVPLAIVAALGACRLGGARGHAMMFVAGGLAGALLIVKYHALILLLSMGVAWAWSLWRRDLAWPRAIAWTAGVAAGLGLAFMAGVAAALHGGNPLTTSWTNDAGTVWAWGIAGPLLALGDTFELLRLVARHLGSLAPSDGLVRTVSIAFVVVFVAWIVSARQAVADTARDVQTSTRRIAWRLALSTVVVTAVALIVLMQRDASISWEGRHQQYGAFLALPFFAEAIRRAWRFGRWPARATTFVLAVLVLIVPVTYGAATLVNDVVRRTPAEWHDAGPNGVPFAWTVKGAGGVAFHDRLSALPWFPRALVATSSWEAFFMFPGHRVLAVPEHASGDPLHFSGRPADGVALLLPSTSSQADVEGIERMFADVHQWTRINMPDAPEVQVLHGE